MGSLLGACAMLTVHEPAWDAAWGHAPCMPFAIRYTLSRWPSGSRSDPPMVARGFNPWTGVWTFLSQVAVPVYRPPVRRAPSSRSDARGSRSDARG